MASASQVTPDLWALMTTLVTTMLTNPGTDSSQSAVVVNEKHDKLRTFFNDWNTTTPRQKMTGLKQDFPFFIKSKCLGSKARQGNLTLSSISMNSLPLMDFLLPFLSFPRRNLPYISQLNNSSFVFNNDRDVVLQSDEMKTENVSAGTAALWVPVSTTIISWRPGHWAGPLSQCCTERKYKLVNCPQKCID